MADRTPATGLREIDRPLPRKERRIGSVGRSAAVFFEDGALAYFGYPHRPCLDATNESSSQQFRPVLEVRRVEVPPLAAPDEAVSFEDLHEFERDAILVGTIPSP